MPRYVLVFGSVLATTVALFLAVERADVPMLSDPSIWLDGGGSRAGAAAIGLALLVGDVVLPVPSSLVMVAHGAVFGVLLGTLLSLAGSVGAALVGFGLGRLGGPWMHRLVGEREQRRADELLEHWGDLAIVVTRPLPLVAETVAVMAGASRMRTGRVALMAALGSAPAALLYALAGATAARLDDAFLVFALVLGIAGLTWWIGGTRWAISGKLSQGRASASHETNGVSDAGAVERGGLENR